MCLCNWFLSSSSSQIEWIEFFSSGCILYLKDIWMVYCVLSLPPYQSESLSRSVFDSHLQPVLDSHLPKDDKAFTYKDINTVDTSNGLDNPEQEDISPLCHWERVLQEASSVIFSLLCDARSATRFVEAGSSAASLTSSDKGWHGSIKSRR